MNEFVKRYNFKFSPPNLLKEFLLSKVYHQEIKIHDFVNLDVFWELAS